MTALAESIVDAGQAIMAENGEAFHHLEGRAVPFGVFADVGLFLERHARDSFTDSLARKWRLPLLWAHDSKRMPVGLAEVWDSRSDGLWGRWTIAPSPVAQEAAKWAREGGLGLSIGFQPVRSQWDYASEWDPHRGPDYMDRVTRLESRLLEVSLTPTPAFEQAVVDWVEATSLDGSDRSLLAAMRSWVDRYRHETSRQPLAPRSMLPTSTPANESYTPVAIDERVTELEDTVDNHGVRITALEGLGGNIEPPLTPAAAGGEPAPVPS
jgi:HK97 family phage prohead protease